MIDSRRDGEVKQLFDRAQEAIATQDWRTALEHLQRCLDLLGEDTAQRRAFKAMVTFHQTKCLTHLHGPAAAVDDPTFRTTLRQLLRDVYRLAISVSQQEEAAFDRTYPGALLEAEEGAVLDPLLKGETFFTFGLRATGKGDTRDAVDLFTKALELLDPSDALQRELIAEGHMRLASLYSELGREEESADHATLVLLNQPALNGPSRDDEQH